MNDEEILKALNPKEKKMSDYPKYQISKFLDAKRDYQVVVRTDSIEELTKAMEDVKPLIKSLETTPSAPKTAETSTSQQPQSERTLSGKCSDCGAEMVHRTGVGKKGPWEALFCPNAVKGEYDQHKAIFL